MPVSFNFARKYVFHFILWILVTISLGIDASEIYSLSLSLFFFFIFAKTAVLLVLVYLNLLLFYPLYFTTRKYLSYFLCIIVITLIAGYLNTKLELFIREKRGLTTKPDQLIFFLKQFFMAVRYVLTAFLLQITVDFYEQKEKIKKVELEKTIAELNFLKAQINPHFLFNTLNNLYALIIEKSEKSGECVLKLADILKYILSEGKEDRVSLKKELVLLDNYIELEKLRKPDADVSFSTETNTNSCLITPLILLPFVENAFKHGLNTVANGGFIHLHIKVIEKLLTLSIENNIPPANNTVAIQSHGIGIENVRKRLDLVYPNSYQLLIEKKSHSFLVNLQLQLA
jgi:two-component system, LytTR family, sensor kinase